MMRKEVLEKFKRDYGCSSLESDYFECERVTILFSELVDLVDRCVNKEKPKTSSENEDA
jgi:hypothetical protein